MRFPDWSESSWSCELRTVFHLPFELRDLLVDLLNFGRFFSGVDHQQSPLLSQVSQLGFSRVACLIAFGQRGCGARGFRGVKLATSASMRCILCFEKLFIKTGKAFDNSVLAGVERNDLVVVGVVEQTLFIGANVFLQFGDALLQKVGGADVRVASLFDVVRNISFGNCVNDFRGDFRIAMRVADIDQSRFFIQTRATLSPDQLAGRRASRRQTAPAVWLRPDPLSRWALRL